MSSVQVAGNASGTGVLTVTSPNTNSSFTLTLPAATTTLVGTDATQTLTNKTLSGATWTSPSSSTITSGTAVASTSGTSIDFTGIPSWVKRITVMLSGVSTNGTSIPQIQIGSGSFSTSGYTSGSQVTAQTSASSGFILVNAGSTSASNTLIGTMTLVLINSNTWVVNGVMYINGSNNSYNSGISPALSGTLDRVRITTVNGTDTFDAGSINILYE